MSVATHDEVTADSEDALEFVRFCHARRRLPWPELYDEMCAVARRRLFRGWGFDELSEHGVGFGLFQLPELSALVARVDGEGGPGRAAAVDGIAAAAPRVTVVPSQAA